jgi:hypothetical protein
MFASLKTSLFCGLAKKMTSEHVEREWTKGYVERTANKHTQANVFIPRPGEPAPNVPTIKSELRSPNWTEAG